MQGTVNSDCLFFLYLTGCQKALFGCTCIPAPKILAKLTALPILSKKTTTEKTAQ